MALKIMQPIQPAGDFPAVYSDNVDANGEALTNFIPIILTQREYNTLVENGSLEINGEIITFQEKRIYLIKRFVDEAEGV